MTTISFHTMEELAQAEEKNEILLETNTNTQLHIIRKPDRTLIRLSLGNKFDIVNGVIVIHEKNKP